MTAVVSQKADLIGKSALEYEQKLKIARSLLDKSKEELELASTTIGKLKKELQLQQTYYEKELARAGVGVGVNRDVQAHVHE